MCCLHLTETTLRSSVIGEKDYNRIWIIIRSRYLSLLSLGLEYHSFHPDLNIDTLVWGLQIFVIAKTVILSKIVITDITTVTNANARQHGRGHGRSQCLG